MHGIGIHDNTVLIKIIRRSRVTGPPDKDENWTWQEYSILLIIESNAHSKYRKRCMQDRKSNYYDVSYASAVHAVR